MLHIRVATLALAATALAISSCGGSTKSSSDTASNPQSTPTVSVPANTAPLTRAKLIAQADTICGRIYTRLNHRRQAVTQQAIAGVALELAAYERGSVTELEKLVPPASLANDWKQIVAGVHVLAADAAKIGEYAKANQLETPAGQAFIARTGVHGIHAAAVARRDGFTGCAATI